MKVGDLISFKPIGFGDDDWSNPGIVLREWEHLDRNKKPMWIVWCDGFEIIMVVRVEDNPYAREHTSKNERRFYFINWMQKEGPASRWGTHGYHASTTGYFLRNDLKFVK